MNFVFGSVFLVKVGFRHCYHRSDRIHYQRKRNN